MPVGAMVTAGYTTYKAAKESGLIRGKFQERPKIFVTYLGGKHKITVLKGTNEPIYWGREAQAIVNKRYGSQYEWDYYREFSSAPPPQEVINRIYEKYGNHIGQQYGVYTRAGKVPTTGTSPIGASPVGTPTGKVDISPLIIGAIGYLLFK